MAKSIRSKIKKEFRSRQRATVGEAQLRKNLRKSIRRLKTTLETAPVPSSNSASSSDAAAEGAEGAAAAAGTKEPGVIAQLRAKLAGGDGSATAIAASVRGGDPVQKTKKLRYTFNTSFREHRLEEQLEDLTDDEEEVLLGRVEDAGADAAGMDQEGGDGPAEDYIEQSGVKKSARKPIPKRDITTKFRDILRDGSVGMYTTDPILADKKQRFKRVRGPKSKGGSAKPGSAKAHFWAQHGSKK